MNWLTRQEKFVLATIVCLLLVGSLVKVCRPAMATAKAPTPASR